jgi:hypothetical protein
MPVSFSTSSDTSLQLAKDWIQDCTTNHMACRSNETTKFMPTRLIDLDEDLFQPRLVNSCDMLEQAAFNTLSHCWGLQSDQRLELRASNISSMKIGIPLSQLPITFYQAMRLCKELGVRYLWIDALCIIQDSEEDWVRESAVMADIYQNAFCNIAATASANGTQGCFRQREPMLIKPCLVHLERPDIVSEEPELRGGFFGRVKERSIDALLKKLTISTPARVCQIKSKRDDLYYIIDPLLWDLEITDAPLNQRAWVVQERVFSLRTLHFGESQLFWSCKERRACESFPTGYEISTTPPQHPDIARTLPLMSSEERYFITCPSPSAYWQKIVLEYSRCSLTKDSDKMVAFAALERSVRAMKNGEECLAGLWKGNFVHELLWDSRDTIIPCSYLAPSWSWASIHGYTMVGNHVGLPIPSIIDAKIFPRSENDPRLTGGYVRLEGQLRKALLYIPPLRAFGKPPRTFSDEIPPYSVLLLGTSVCLQPSWFKQREPHTCGRMLPTPNLSSIASERCLYEVYCTPIINFDGTSISSSQRVGGLTLLSSGKRGEYRRYKTFMESCDGKFSTFIDRVDGESLLPHRTTLEIGFSVERLHEHITNLLTHGPDPDPNSNFAGQWSTHIDEMLTNPSSVCNRTPLEIQPLGLSESESRLAKILANTDKHGRSRPVALASDFEFEEFRGYDGNGCPLYTFSII